MNSTCDELLTELRESSVALLEALRQRNPQYLEHLERRERALRSLKRQPLEERHVPILREAERAGADARHEAQAMHDETLRRVHRLETHRQFSVRLGAGLGSQQAALDVNG